MKRMLPLILCLVYSLSLNASTPPDTRPFGFTENKGQVKNQNNQANSRVNYIWAAASGVNIQLRNSGISFDTYQNIAGTSDIAFHRLDMNFPGSAHPEIIPGKVLEGVTNYATPGTSISNIKSYQSITYKNIYEGIDFVVKATDKGLLKYDFIVRDAAHISDLKIEYAGFDTFEIEDGKLRFTLSGKTITEEIPASWMTASGRPVSVHYKVLKKSDHRVQIGFFTHENLSKSDGELVIDPLAVREWATYYGDALYDKPEGIATDSLGNIFIVGTTRSIDRMASSDGYQNIFSGGSTDVFVTRFNQHGLRQWATYYGGSGDDQGLGVDVDSYERIFISGSTTSQDSIGSPGAHQAQNGGGKDGFIAEFDRHGNFIWDSFIGSSGDETATACYSDNLGNVLVAGYTDAGGFLSNDSISPLLAYTSGIDAFMVKFNSEGNMTWTSYFGSTGDDYASAIVVDSLKSWVMAGTTNSATGISAGLAFQSEFGGETDGFIVKIDSTGNLDWATYFGGAGGDSIAGITTVNGNYFISGKTDSTLAYSNSTAFQANYGGGGDAFAAGLDTDGSLNWFTYIGGTAENEATGISRDYAGDIYVAGTTLTDSVFNADTTGVFPVTANYDYFVSKFDRLGQHIYNATYGGEQDDRCSAIAVFGYTSIYLTGTTNSFENMVLDGPEEDAFQTTKDSVSLDGFIVRLTQFTSTPPMYICSANYDSTGVPPPIGICLGDSIKLQLGGGALGQGAQWVWYEGECGGIDNYIGEGNEIWVSPDSTTTYFVRSESVEREGACIYKTVHVDYPNTAIASANDSICPGSTLELFGDGGYYYDWSGPESYFSDDQNPIIDTVQYNQAGTYTLIATTQFGCKDTATVDVFLLSPPDFSTSTSNVTCNGGNDGSASVIPGDTATIDIFWPELATDSATISNLSAGNYSLIVTNYNGCVSGESISITQPDPLIDSLETKGAYCDQPDGEAQVYISGSNSPFEIIWSPGGQSGNTVNNLLPGSHTVTVTDALGCVDSQAFTTDNMGQFNAIIQPDSIFLEYFETADIEVITIPVPDNPTYEWAPPEGLSCTDCSNPTLDPDSSTWYTVWVSSSHGCKSSDSLYVERALPEPNTFLPDAFSPNGDGLNDKLCLLGVRIVRFELQIFDRSGKEIFHSSSLSNCWDGNINGAPAIGTYIYTLQAELEEGKTINESGNITIQR